MLTAVELKDVSMLSPMSVKDAIWLDCATSLKRKEDFEFENDKAKFIGEQFENLGELLMDVREVAMHTDSYVQIAALKQIKNARMNPLKHESLPSYIFAKEKQKREEDRKRQKSNGSDANGGKAKKKKYANYQEYLEAEEKDNKEEQDRLYRNAMAFTSHVRKLEERQGGFDSSKGARQLASEEERLRKIREERRLKEEAEKGKGTAQNE